MKKYFYIVGLLLISGLVVFGAMRTSRHTKVEIFNLTAKNALVSTGGDNRINIHGSTVPDTEVALLAKHSKYYTLVEKTYSDAKGGFSLSAVGSQHRQQYVVTINKKATNLDINTGKFIRFNPRHLSKTFTYYPTD